MRLSKLLVILFINIASFGYTQVTSDWTKENKASLNHEMLRHSIDLGVFDLISLNSWEEDRVRTLASLYPKLIRVPFDQWTAMNRDELIDATIVVFDDVYDDLYRQFGANFMILDSMYRARNWREDYMSNLHDIRGYWRSNEELLPDVLILDSLFWIWSPIFKLQRFTSTWSLSRDTLNLESAPYTKPFSCELFYLGNEAIILKFINAKEYLVDARRVQVEPTVISRESLIGIWKSDYSGVNLWLNDDSYYKMTVGNDHVEERGTWDYEEGILIRRGEYRLWKEKAIYLCDGDLFLENQYGEKKLTRYSKVN